MLKAEGLLAAVGKRDGNDGAAYWSVTIIDQDTGQADQIDLNGKRDGLLKLAQASLHQLVRVEVSKREYWNDVPGGGRKPSTVLKAESIELLGVETIHAAAAAA